MATFKKQELHGFLAYFASNMGKEIIISNRFKTIVIEKEGFFENHYGKKGIVDISENEFKEKLGDLMGELKNFLELLNTEED